jgi:protein SCO1/2
MRQLLFTLAIVACSSSRTTHEPIPAAPVAAPAPTERASDAPSIYDLDITLRDARGETVGLDVARGAPVLVTMFYASCSVACPALIGDVKRVLAELGRDDVRVLLVSFDPARDTPAALAELARVHGLDERWTVASTEQARELAATLGYDYRAVDNGEFFHGAAVVALDADGRPIARSEGFGQRAPLIAALSLQE